MEPPKAPDSAGDGFHAASPTLSASAVPPPPPPPRLRRRDLWACNLVLFKFSFLSPLFIFKVFFFSSLRLHSVGAQESACLPGSLRGVRETHPSRRAGCLASGARGSQAAISPAGFRLPKRPSILAWGKFVAEFSLKAILLGHHPTPPRPLLPPELRLQLVPGMFLYQFRKRSRQ